MAWIIVFATKKQRDIKKIDKRSLIFLILSGVATGASWLCYYKALQDGLASIVVPIDKLSILVTVLFAYIFLKEKLSKKSLLGLILIVLCEPIINTIIHEKINTIIVLIAVATWESTSLTPILAKIDVTPAKNAEANANNTHIFKNSSLK